MQQPAAGVYSALNDLTTTLSKKKGKNSLITSTGCKSKKHTIGVTVSYVAEPEPAGRPRASDTADAKCS